MKIRLVEVNRVGTNVFVKFRVEDEFFELSWDDVVSGDELKAAGIDFKKNIKVIKNQLRNYMQQKVEKSIPQGVPVDVWEKVKTATSKAVKSK